KVFDSALASPASLRLLGIDVRWPAAEDLLLLLCVHGGKHRWDELKWIVDIAELLRARPDLDWRAVAGKAPRAGAWGMLAVALLLANEMLDAPLPSSVLDAVRATPRSVPLAAEVGDHLHASATAPGPVAETLPYIQECLSFLAGTAERADMRLSCIVLPFAYSALYGMVRPGIAALRRASSLLTIRSS